MTYHIIPYGELHKHEDSNLCPCHPYVEQDQEDHNIYIVHFHIEDDEEEDEEGMIEEVEGEFDIMMN